MKIDHIAIWVNDLEIMKQFYVHYFNLKCSEIYINTRKQFSSYFLSFDSGARIEIMHRADITGNKKEKNETTGMTHFAISVGSKEKVNQLTELIRRDSFEIASEPRTTGDGYCESVVLDPEGNRIEITE